MFWGPILILAKICNTVNNTKDSLSCFYSLFTNSITLSIYQYIDI